MSETFRVDGVGKIYKRGKVWYLDYTVDGRRKQERGSPNKAAALKMLGTRVTDAERGMLNFTRREVVHFSDFTETYLQHKLDQPRRKVKSLRSIRGSIRHLVEYFGNTPLSRITPEAVEKYRDHRAKQRIHGLEPAELREKIKAAKVALVLARKSKKPAPLRVVALEKRIAKLKEQLAGEGRTMKERCINRELATLKNIFNVARKKKCYHGDNPVGAVEYFPEPSRLHKILTNDEYARLIAAADPRLRPIIQVAVRTGLRKGDILRLEWKNVDMEQRRLKAWVSKTEGWHEQPIQDGLANILASIPRLGPYVFTNPRTGTRLKDIAKWWSEAKEGAGMGDEDFTFHDLRANAGTRVANEAGLFAAQMLLDHKNGATTAKYLNRTLEAGVAATKALEDFFTEEVEREPAVTNPLQEHRHRGLTVEESIS